jgi:hypothetical protein
MAWVVFGYDEGEDTPAFERELPELTTDEVRSVTDETGLHPWDGAWPVEDGLLALVRRHVPKGVGLERRECFLEWRD